MDSQSRFLEAGNLLRRSVTVRRSSALEIPLYEEGKEPFRTYVRKLNDYANAMCFNEEDLKRFIPVTLSGAAREAYGNLPKPAKSGTVKTLIDSLQTVICTPEKQALAQARMSNVRQDSTSVEIFASKCQDLAEEAYPGNKNQNARDAILLTTFINGLNPKIRREVRRRTPMDFGEAKQVALHEEAITAVDNAQEKLQTTVASLLRDVKIYEDQERNNNYDSNPDEQEWYPDEDEDEEDYQEWEPIDEEEDYYEEEEEYPDEEDQEEGDPEYGNDEEEDVEEEEEDYPEDEHQEEDYQEYDEEDQEGEEEGEYNDEDDEESRFTINSVFIEEQQGREEEKQQTLPRRKKTNFGLKIFMIAMCLTYLPVTSGQLDIPGPKAEVLGKSFTSMGIILLAIAGIITAGKRYCPGKTAAASKKGNPAEEVLKEKEQGENTQNSQKEEKEQGETRRTTTIDETEYKEGTKEAVQKKNTTKPLHEILKEARGSSKGKIRTPRNCSKTAVTQEWQSSRKHERTETKEENSLAASQESPSPFQKQEETKDRQQNETKGKETPTEEPEESIELALPQCKESIEKFLRICHCFQYFTKNYAEITNTLEKCIQKNTNFTWRKEHQDAFEKLKEELNIGKEEHTSRKAQIRTEQDKSAQGRKETTAGNKYRNERNLQPWETRRKGKTERSFPTQHQYSPRTCRTFHPAVQKEYKHTNNYFPRPGNKGYNRIGTKREVPQCHRQLKGRQHQKGNSEIVHSNTLVRPYQGRKVYPPNNCFKDCKREEKQGNQTKLLSTSKEAVAKSLGRKTRKEEETKGVRAKKTPDPGNLEGKKESKESRP